MKRNYVIGSVVVVLLLALVFFNPFQQSKKRGNEKAVSGQRTVLPSSPVIKVEPAEGASSQPQTPVTDDPNFVSGVVEPYLDVTLGLVVQGRIDRINFPEGRKVPKGGVILNLEKNLEELEVARRKIIWMNHAELKSAQVTVSTLTASLKSNRTLYDETRSVSKEELDKLSLQWENAVADRDRLLNQEQREKVEYDIAVKALESRLLKAPVTGVVEKVFLKAGEVYQPGQPLVRLIDSERCLLTANLDDTRSYNLKKGMLVDLLINVGATEVKKKGEITKVPSVVDPASGVMQVKVVFENSDGSIKPGVTARMRLPEQ